MAGITSASVALATRVGHAITQGVTTTITTLSAPAVMTVDPPTVPIGVCIAFRSAAMTLNPIWTRIDDHAGIDIVAQWDTDRGRSSELDKTKTGTATIEIVDKFGVLDPTNSTSPIFALGAGASIDPMRQVSISIKNPLTGIWTSRFRGFIDEIEMHLDEAENVFRGTISCVDMFAILSRHEVVPDNGRPIGTGGTGSQVKTPVDSAGDVFYEDGQVDDRVRAALADANVPGALTVVFSGNVKVQETVYAVRSQILQILQDAADAEFPGVSNCYVDNLGRVAWHGRNARFDPVTVAAGAGDSAWNFTAWKAGDKIAWTADHTYAPIKTITFNRGMNSIINAALATPQNILDKDIQGQLSFDAGSLTTYSVSSWSAENLVTGGGKTDGLDKNGETKLYSDYYKNNFASPRTRISTLVFKNVHSGHVAQDAAYAFLCGVEIADTIDVLTHHPGGGGFNETFYVEGVRYSVTPLHGSDFHLIDLEVDISPAAYFTTPIPHG